MSKNSGAKSDSVHVGFKMLKREVSGASTSGSSAPQESASHVSDSLIPEDKSTKKKSAHDRKKSPNILFV